MLATETTAIVTRLNLVGLIPVRDPAAVQVWHEDIGHLAHADALAAARWLEHNRDSGAFGPVKPADLLAALKRVRRARVEAALGGSPTPPPPRELDDDPATGVRWQQACIEALASGRALDAQQASEHADLALGVVRRDEITSQRPVAALVAQVGAALRSPGTRETA